MIEGTCATCNAALRANLALCVGVQAGAADAVAQEKSRWWDLHPLFSISGDISNKYCPKRNSDQNDYQEEAPLFLTVEKKYYSVIHLFHSISFTDSYIYSCLGST